MRVAVLTLTRDRLAYTQHCFGKLRELAGCPFDHYVLDQGSTDGTAEWLTDYYDCDLTLLDENVGISRGMNRLLDVAGPENYDVIAKVDNDCELLVPDTLKACCDVALTGLLASPHIMGLDHPPVVEREVEKDGYRVGIPNIMGGIFMAGVAPIYENYRHDENNPIWGLDDAKIVEWWRSLGFDAGYLLDFKANHFLTTAGQRADDPVYYARKEREFSGR